VTGLGRVDGDPAVRPRRHDRFSVGRNDVKKKTDPLRGDRAGLAAGDVLDEEPGTVPRLVARDEDPAPIREPGRRLAVDAGFCELLRLSGACRQERKLTALLVTERQHPPPVRRETQRVALPDADRGGAVEPAQVDALRLNVLL